MDHDPSRSGREGTLCQSQTGFGGPLSASAGYFRQSARGAVPPRSLQPVPLESVLGRAADGQDRIGIERSQWLTSETNFPGWRWQGQRLARELVARIRPAPRSRDFSSGTVSSLICEQVFLLACYAS